MLAVWPTSYVNYVPTNDLILVSRFWKPGRSFTIKRRDDEARDVLRELFPGREIVQVYLGEREPGRWRMNCITQQQPASATFARLCGWAKVQVDAQVATLYAAPIGQHALGTVPRLRDLVGTSTCRGSRRQGSGCRSGSWAPPGSMARSAGLTRRKSRARERSARPSTHGIERRAPGNEPHSTHLRAVRR